MASLIHEALESILAGQDLNADAADAAMTQIMSGQATDAQIGAFLAGLRIKGESIAEITGCARAMKRVAVPVRPALNGQRLLDTCGTGGDQTGTFNISTTVAFVVAGAGEKVAKHGNRSASSQCGSADVLEVLGVRLDLGPEQVAECIEDVGIGFLFAPLYHPAMKYAIGPRRELATRTIFNILGPLKLCVFSINLVSESCAAPLSIDSAAAVSPASQSPFSVAKAAAAFNSTTSRLGPCSSPLRIPRVIAAFVPASPPTRSSSDAGERPRSVAESSLILTSPSRR